jgi:WD40 repeat protein
MWEWPSRRLLKQIALGLDSVGSIAITPDGKRLTATASAESLTRFWDIETGQPVPPPEGHASTVEYVRFTSDGAVVTAGLEGEVHIWDVTAGRTIRQIASPGFQRGIRFLTASADGQFLVTGYGGSPSQAPLTIWDTTTGQGHPPLGPRGMSCDRAALSLDGRRLAAAFGLRQVPDQPDELRVWDVRTGRLERQFEVDGWACFRFSPDGRLLAAGGRRSPVVWNVDTGELVWRGDGSVRAVAFSPDGRSLACFEFQSLRLYEMASGRERLRIDIPECRSTLTYGVPIEFSPDGRLIAAPHGNGIGFWDAATGRLLRRFEGHCAGVTSLAFAPDRRTLATASYDTTTLLWPVPNIPADWVPLRGEAAATAWADFASTDAAVAYGAMQQLRADPARAVESCFAVV